MLTDPAFVALNNLHFAHGSAPATLADINWQIPRGAFHCLIGRSGCGKTTLLKLAAGLLLPTCGTVTLAEQTLHAPAANVGFVFQTPTLLAWRNALDNVLLPLTLTGKAKPADSDKARDLLNLLGLAGLAARYPHQLSGGQQSRVALARALINDPSVLLLDEPFAALDALTREQLQDELMQICDHHHLTALLVTHDIAEAVYLGDRVALMSNGQLSDAFDIALPRPRGRDMRYHAPFNALCQQLRQRLEQAR